MAGLSGAFDPRLIVLSARAPIELEPFAFAWFPMSFTPDGPQIDGEDLARGWSVFARFLDEAVAAYDVDPARVYVAGFSQGGMLALSTMLTSPERVAGAVCMSGHLPVEVLPHVVSAERRAGKPILIVHGLRDGTLPVELGRRARDMAAELGFAVDYIEFDLPHTTTDESIGAVDDWLRERLDR